MNRKPDRAEDLLLEMRSSVSPVDAPEAVRARRERTVAHLRGLQARSAVLRQVRSTWRKRLLVAAAFLVPSLALGASFVRWSELAAGERESAPPAPANVPNPARPAGRVSPRSLPIVDVGATPHETGMPAPTANDDEGRGMHGAAHAAPPSFATTPEEPSSLAAENRLMLAAMSARRAGDDARAVRILTELLTRHPTSPLAQNAAVERFRALKRIGDEQAAARAARRYLREYPVGMASDEAQSLAAEPKPETPFNAFPR